MCICGEGFSEIQKDNKQLPWVFIYVHNILNLQNIDLSLMLETKCSKHTNDFKEYEDSFVNKVIFTTTTTTTITNDNKLLMLSNVKNIYNLSLKNSQNARQH